VLQRNQIPRDIELTIEALIDKLYENKKSVIHFACTPSRARYISNWFQYIRVLSAILSCEQYTKDSKEFARGSYWNIDFHATNQGLYVEVFDEPRPTWDWMLLQTAFCNKSFTLECDSPKEAARVKSRLVRFKGRMVKKADMPELSRLLITIDTDSHLVNIDTPETRAQKLIQPEIQILDDDASDIMKKQLAALRGVDTQ